MDREKTESASQKEKMTKKIKSLEKKLNESNMRYSEIEEEFSLFKKEQESSPISLVKEELSKRLLEIHELQSQLSKNEEVKNEYRKHFDRLKNEVLRLKDEVRFQFPIIIFN